MSKQLDESNPFLKPYFILEKRVTGDLSLLSNQELQDLYNDSLSTQTYFNNNQMMVKLCANSVYGACANIYYRFCNYEVAADITGEGKWSMFTVDKAVNDYYRCWQNDLEMEKLLQEKFDSKIKLSPVTIDVCNYGDTDSRYINYGAIIKAANFTPTNNKQITEFIIFLHENRLQQLIKMKLDQQIKAKNGENFIIMELEVIGGKGIFLAKKKYVMSLLWKDGKYIAKDGKMKAVGVELQQSTSSKFVKNAMKKVINALLKPGFPMSDTYKLAAIVYNQALAADQAELIKVTSINNYDQYVLEDREKTVFAPKCSRHLKAAAYYNQYIYLNNLEATFPRIKSGQRIKWYYTANDGCFGWPSDIDPPEWLPVMDYRIQIEKLIFTPLKRYLSDGSDTNNFGSTTIQATFKQSFV